MQQRVIILWSLTHATSCNQASIFQDVVAICLLMSFIEAYFWQLWHEDCPGLMVCDWLAHCLHCIQGALFLSKKKDTFSRGVPNWWIWPLMMYFTTDAVKDCSRPFLEISTPLHGVGVKFARGSWPLTAGTVRLRWNLLSDSCRKTCQADVVLCALKTKPHAMHWTGTLPSKDKIRYWPGRCCSTHSHKFSRASHRFGRPRRARLCSGLGLSSTITMQLESDMGQSRLWLPCPGPTGSELACCSGLAICSGWAGLTNLKALTRVWQCGHGLTCTPAKPSRKSCHWPFSKWPLCWTELWTGPGLIPVCEKKLSLYTDRWWTGRRNMWTGWWWCDYQWTDRGWHDACSSTHQSGQKSSLLGWFWCCHYICHCAVLTLHCWGTAHCTGCWRTECKRAIHCSMSFGRSYSWRTVKGGLSNRDFRDCWLQ